MHTLTHYRLCPHSRSIRLALGELGLGVDEVEERPWEWKPAFLALNPAGELPVLVLEGGPVLCGAYSISEYLAEWFTAAAAPHESLPTLFPGSSEDRAETRRLVDWFHGKAHRETTRDLLEERVYGHLNAGSGHVPDPHLLRAARANLKYHLSYVSYLADQRRWLAGEELSFADMSAAAHFSVADYLGEVPWEEYPAAKSWYGRMKSRPAFRPLLADRIPGTNPAPVYVNLDF